MGEERIIVRSKNWQQKREVQYWTRLLNITESEALADTKNKPVDTPPAPAADKKRVARRMG